MSATWQLAVRAVSPRQPPRLAGPQLLTSVPTLGPEVHDFYSRGQSTGSAPFCLGPWFLCTSWVRSPGLVLGFLRSGQGLGVVWGRAQSSKPFCTETPDFGYQRGFPWGCQGGSRSSDRPGGAGKSLLLPFSMSVPQAMEWLIEHAEDPTVDAPLPGQASPEGAQAEAAPEASPEAAGTSAGDEEPGDELTEIFKKIRRKREFRADARVCVPGLGAARRACAASTREWSSVRGS